MLSFKKNVNQTHVLIFFVLLSSLLISDISWGKNINNSLMIRVPFNFSDQNPGVGSQFSVVGSQSAVGEIQPSKIRPMLGYNSSYTQTANLETFFCPDYHSARQAPASASPYPPMSLLWGYYGDISYGINWQTRNDNGYPVKLYQVRSSSNKILLTK